MKIDNLTQKLKGPKGEELTTFEDGKVVPLVFGEAIYGSCFADPPKDSAFSSDVRSMASKIAFKTATAQADGGVLELKSEEVTLLKTLAAIRFTTIVYGAMEVALGEASED